MQQVGGGKKKKKGSKGKGGGPNSTRRASGQSIQPLQSPVSLLFVLGGVGLMLGGCVC